MDILMHQRRYFQAISQDPMVGGREFAAGTMLGDRPAIEVLKEQGFWVAEAIANDDRALYWASIEGHQAALLEVQERNTASIFPPDERDPWAVLDFIQKYGWRRFRFSNQILRIQMRIDGELWSISVLPNYREKHLKKLKDIKVLDKNHVVIDAVEMENFLCYGDPEKARRMLKEKLGEVGASRHILWGDELNPQFVKLALKRSNSSLHVGDWALPLRS